MLNRRDALLRLGLAMVILVLLNVISYYYYYRIDLTSEKRYSISQPSKDVIKGLKDEVTIRIYLGNTDLNAGFKRLQDDIKNILKDFQAYGGSKVEYEIINPEEITDPQQLKTFQTDLMSRGLSPVNLRVKTKSGMSDRMIFPSALVVYGGREFPINLLENQIGYGPQDVLNHSSILLEYKFINAINKLTQYRPPQVAIIEGHGELANIELASIQETLKSLQYEVKHFNLSQSYYIPDRFDAIIIAKPRYSFNNDGERDKYKIDQYVMRGGKVLWLVDGTNAEMDSLRVNREGQIVNGLDIGLDDMLFKYGARINNDVVQDINLYNQIPLVVGKMGNAPQTEMFPWYYFPLLVSDNAHPISRNLDPVAAYFASSIDTVKNPGISKTILLHTTENAKAQMAPTRVHFGMLQGKPNPAYFNQPELPVAVLLEGQFESAFTNRMSPQMMSAFDTVQSLKFIAKAEKPGKMIVVADGDIIRNDINRDSTAYPLGFYKYTNRQFANSDFILNCIEYLVDDNGILQTRNKEVKLRLLNTVKAQEEKLKWQLLNIALPIGLVIIFGVAFGYYRRRKYAS
ncbi:MAG: gliding motility-associated ABC transporter substrate-binding protein GldG [Bacteroidetes bacterium]|nr:gliding motility-associated ABC transporter substrate-binding protein GldG [Bacteroidota bacterium]